MLTKRLEVFSRDLPAFRSILIGCDPEFLLVGEGDLLLNAAEYIGAEAGAEFGVDGASFPAELRPAPSSSPAHVVRRLAELLKHESGDVQQFEWWVGNGHPLHTVGGHIHISMDSDVRGRICSPDARWDALLEALDALLVPFAICLSEPRHFDRRKGTYGTLKAYRETSRYVGIEYRTLPSWLYDPQVALFFMQGAKAITMALGSGNLDWLGLVRDVGIIAPVLYGGFTDVSSATLKEALKERIGVYAAAMRDLAYMKPTYAEDALQHVLELIARGVVWDAVDVRENWLNVTIATLPRGEPRPLPVLSFFDCSTIDPRLLQPGSYVIWPPSAATVNIH